MALPHHFHRGLGRIDIMKAYQLKITIKDTHPPIWRRVIVPAGLSFSQLAIILNTTMGWCGYHLNSFTVKNAGLLLEDIDDDFEPFMFVELDTVNQNEYIIDEIFDLDEVKSFTYTYDFGDDWTHQVQIEKVLNDYKYSFAQVIKYKGDTPWEDCGGVWGYYNMLETLANPKAEDYKSIKEWTDSHWSDEYDMDEVNRELSQMKVVNTKTKPVSVHELYQEFFAKNELKLKKVQVPENREKRIFDYDWDDDLWLHDGLESPTGADYIADIINGTPEVGAFLFMAESVINLSKNLNMTEAQVMDAMEVSKENRAELEELVRLTKMLRQ